MNIHVKLLSLLKSLNYFYSLVKPFFITDETGQSIFISGTQGG